MVEYSIFIPDFKSKVYVYLCMIQFSHSKWWFLAIYILWMLKIFNVIFIGFAQLLTFYKVLVTTLLINAILEI